MEFSDAGVQKCEGGGGGGRAAHLYLLCSGGATVSPCFTSLIYRYKSERDKGRRDNVNHEPWKVRVTVLDEYYDSSIYYGRNYYAADATGAPFRNDPEHEAEWVDRLHAMCYWKDKLEVTDKEGHWIRPKDEKDMMIELQPEQELLPEEKAEIGRVESHKETVVDDDLHKALRRVILDMAPVCVAKEGAEMNGRNLKPENVV